MILSKQSSKGKEKQIFFYQVVAYSNIIYTFAVRKIGDKTIN